MIFICSMETYTEYCSKMLFQFQTLLRTDPCVFVKQQLVQIMAINMYQIEVNKQQMKVKRMFDVFISINFTRHYLYNFAQKKLQARIVNFYRDIMKTGSFTFTPPPVHL